ncbi:MAG: DUF2784 domain-containing protein [Holophagaceae bacterium]|nr:DUF2784 domain-containing protein [Holophagaceae bacterium]
MTKEAPPQMGRSSIGADVVFLFHLGAVAFALFGGLLTRWNPAWIWLHAPVALWFVLVNLADWECPLTTLEARLRGPAGSASGGFVQRHLGRLMGNGWTRRGLERATGSLFLVWNAAMYGWVFGLRGWRGGP